jgi:tRNA C32,U32 (ribose-2'-O)-methylase TrmJ
MHIPCNPEYSSLNVAAAVQLMAYEVMLASREGEELDNEAKGQGAPVPAEDMERLYGHLQQTLVEIGFLDPDNPRIMMRRLRRLFNRARPNKVEFNILRGILTAAQRHQRDS